MQKILLQIPKVPLRGNYEWQVSNGNRASARIGCGACKRVCPQSIRIIGELNKAAAHSQDHSIYGAQMQLFEQGLLAISKIESCTLKATKPKTQ